jgi:hypothetical protein
MTFEIEEFTSVSSEAEVGQEGASGGGVNLKNFDAYGKRGL